jgi:hypothetical protein
MSDGAGRREPPVEVNALDDRVNAQDLDAIPLRFDDGRIVADADGDPIWRGRKSGLDMRNELRFGKLRDRCHLA